MFGLIGGGNGTFKQVYAISAHTAIFAGCSWYSPPS